LVITLRELAVAVEHLMQPAAGHSGDPAA
jgi:hypothetical protein